MEEMILSTQVAKLTGYDHKRITFKIRASPKIYPSDKPTISKRCRYGKVFKLTRVQALYLIMHLHPTPYLTKLKQIILQDSKNFDFNKDYSTIMQPSKSSKSSKSAQSGINITAYVNAEGKIVRTQW